MDLAAVVGLISVLIVIVLETRVQVAVLKGKIDLIMQMIKNLLDDRKGDCDGSVERGS